MYETQNAKVFIEIQTIFRDRYMSSKRLDTLC